MERGPPRWQQRPAAARLGFELHAMTLLEPGQSNVRE